MLSWKTKNVGTFKKLNIIAIFSFNNFEKCCSGNLTLHESFFNVGNIGGSPQIVFFTNIYYIENIYNLHT